MQGLWLLLLPVAASCGWFTGRNPKHLSLRSKANPSTLRKDYFAGLNYLINEQPDKAVDVFIKLLEVDSDTVETHLALGSLFRRKGEVDRAIRIHQNLMARPQLDPLHRLHATSALGQDYLKAGVLDRAERIFLELSENKSHEQQSLRYLMRIYQQEREWAKAIEVAVKLQSLSKEPISTVIAQYYCELAERCCAAHDDASAESHLKLALQQDPQCVRATLMQARLTEKSGDYLEAIRLYQKVKQQNVSFLSETVAPLMRCYQKLGEQEAMLDYFKDCLKDHPKISASLASAGFFEYQLSAGLSLQELGELFVNQPSLSGLENLLSLYTHHSEYETKVKFESLQKMVSRLLAHKQLYRCSHCGLSGRMLHWLCPSCQQWAKLKPLVLEDA